MKIETKFHGLTLNADYNLPLKQYRPDVDNWWPDGSIYPQNNSKYLETVKAVTGQDYDNFLKCGRGRCNGNFTYQDLIRLETRANVVNDFVESYDLKTIDIKGEAFRLLDVDPFKILTAAKIHNFKPQRIDLNFDISADFRPYKIIDNFFKEDNLTCTSSWHPETSEQGKCWYVGVKSKNGHRFNFYEAAKIHPELPDGAWRIELQMFGQDARTFASAWLASPSKETATSYMLSLLKKRIQFRSLGKDSNKSRWKIPGWWLEITAGAGNFSEHKPVTKPLKAENQRLWLIGELFRQAGRVGIEEYFYCQDMVKNLLINGGGFVTPSNITGGV